MDAYLVCFNNDQLVVILQVNSMVRTNTPCDTFDYIVSGKYVMMAGCWPDGKLQNHVSATEPIDHFSTPNTRDAHLQTLLSIVEMRLQNNLCHFLNGFKRSLSSKRDGCETLKVFCLAETGLLGVLAEVGDHLDRIEWWLEAEEYHYELSAFGPRRKLACSYHNRHPF